MGIIGLYFVGPQNYVMRVIKERREGKPEEYDFDTKIRKKRKEKMRINFEKLIPVVRGVARKKGRVQ